MIKLPYDQSSKESILNYALQLVDKSLREVIDVSDLDQNSLNKGRFGQILEEYYFYKKLDSNSQPDFPEAGLELKSGAVKKLIRKGELRAKERLVLSIIDYNDLVKQNFKTSSFYMKNAQMLLVFHLHKKNTNVLDYIVKLVGVWAFPAEDLRVIEHDWQLIKSKVENGEAHTLSEGDTFYLGACTKGANASSTRSQPNSNIPAKQRAFSLKPGYVNHILAKLSGVTDGSFGKLVTAPDLELAEYDIERIALDKFKPYYGKTPENIADMLDVDYNPKAKQRFAMLTKEILGVSSKQEIEEFSKADITIKTVRISDKNLPRESLSFPAFKYEEIVKEDSWELSEFNGLLEKRFLFVFFKITDKGLLLDKVLFWNMPYVDRQEAKTVWLRTRRLIKDGNVVEKLEPSDIRRTYFPKKSENRVAHIRPHATNTQDVYPLPVPDKLTKVTSYTKHSFWLNDTYVRDSIYNYNAKNLIPI